MNGLTPIEFSASGSLREAPKSIVSRVTLSAQIRMPLLMIFVAISNTLWWSRVPPYRPLCV